MHNRACLRDNKLAAERHQVVCRLVTQHARQKSVHLHQCKQVRAIAASGSTPPTRFDLRHSGRALCCLPAAYAGSRVRQTIGRQRAVPYLPIVDLLRPPVAAALADVGLRQRQEPRPPRAPQLEHVLQPVDHPLRESARRLS